MSWSGNWEGRATDFVPDLLGMSGKPGRIATVARDAAWEAVQKLGETDLSAFVRIRLQGYEDHLNSPGRGNFQLTIEVIDEPSEVMQDVKAQQPHDLLRRPDVAATLSSPTSD